MREQDYECMLERIGGIEDAINTLVLEQQNLIDFVANSLDAEQRGRTIKRANLIPPGGWEHNRVWALVRIGIVKDLLLDDDSRLVRTVIDRAMRRTL